MLNISWRSYLLAVTSFCLIAESALVLAQAPAAPPAEESPLLVEPQSPEEAFEAAALMQRIGSPGLAKRYIQQVLTANPDDALLLKIRDKHGPAVFLKLANDPGLQPESKTLLEKVNAAFRKRGADPARITKLINDLSGGPRERSVAVESLRSAGAVVVPEILRQASTATGNEKSALVSALVQMGSPVVPVLIGALESPDENIRAVAIDVIGYLGSTAEVPYLWRPAFGPHETPGTSQAARNALTKMLKPEGKRNFQVTSYGAARQLKQVALQHYRNEYPWFTHDGQPTVQVWTWDPQKQTVAFADMTPKAASLYRGFQLAKDAVILSPEDEEAQALFLGFAMANATNRAGWNAPLPTGPGTAFQLALSSGSKLVSDSLTQAMQNGNIEAAVAALQVLAQLATRTQLYGTNAERSPIVAALNYPNPRVQFAAAAAILQLDPDQPFDGASRVVEILTRSLGDSGGPAVLVIDPNITRANGIAGMLQQLGFRGQPITSQTGQTGFKAAVERNDLELIAIQANVTQWTLSQTVANFRADARTANVPILIYGPDWAAKNVQKLVDRTPLAAFALESHTLDFFRQQVDPFMASIKSEPLSGEERAAQAAAGAYWLAHIASGRRTNVFEIASAEPALAASIEDPNLAANALQALGSIPTKSAQRRLQGVAVSNTFSLPLRDQAAIQLAFHIQRHGVLLTAEQIRAVQAAIPQAGDPQLASALASVMGSLKPTPQAVDKQLQQFPIRSPLAP